MEAWNAVQRKQPPLHLQLEIFYGPPFQSGELCTLKASPDRCTPNWSDTYGVYYISEVVKLRPSIPIPVVSF